jgi:hypothetical protein
MDSIVVSIRMHTSNSSSMNPSMSVSIDVRLAYRSMMNIPIDFIWKKQNKTKQKR